MFTEDRGMNGVELLGETTFTEPSADLIKTTWMGPWHALSGTRWCVRELAWAFERGADAGGNDPGPGLAVILERLDQILFTFAASRELGLCL